MTEFAKVLIADDEQAVRDSLLETLASSYRVASAPDGTVALERIQLFRPDVVVSDVHLPGLDGIALMRALENNADAPLVVLTTQSNRDNLAAEALRLGAHNYLAKPVDPEELQAVIRNAIEQRRLMREARSQSAEMQGMAEKLKQSQSALIQAEKIASLGRLVAGIAHEINTPLGVLRSTTDTVERTAQRLVEWSRQQPGRLAEETAKLVDVLSETAAQSRTACDRIHAIVTNLREFAQLDRADMRRADIRQGFESVLSLMQSEFGDDIQVVKEFGAIPEIDCAPRQVNQLLMNLLLNACEAIRRGGKPGQIVIRTWNEAPWVMLEVEDNGPGIPGEHMDRIFDPGFTTKGVQVGTGLGLPIVYQIVKTHQGRIKVDSQPGRGSKFTVALPETPYL